MNTEHLTDEQFTALLAGEPPDPPARLHLAACDPCQREIEAVLFATEGFNTLSMRWAEAEAPQSSPGA